MWVLALALSAGCGGESATAELVEAEPEANAEAATEPEEQPEPHGGESAGSALPTPITIAGGVAWVVEEPLFARRPSSPIRTAEYGVRGQEAAVLSVFHFTEAQGGGGPIDENVDRWLRQFTGADGQPITRPQATVTETVVNDLPVTSVEVAGTFIGMRGASAGAPPREGWRMLGAIVQGQLGPVFFKLTGPAESVDAAEAAFRRLIESLHPA